MTDVGLHVLGCRVEWQTAMTETDTENGYKRTGLNSDALTLSLSLSLCEHTVSVSQCVEAPLMLHVEIFMQYKIHLLIYACMYSDAL